MADRATVLSGAFQKVTLGPSSKILGAGKYAISGVTRKTVDVSEFGVDMDIFEWASADGGTISLTDVMYDPTCPEQLTLEAAVLNQVKLINSETTGIRFWINSTSYFTISPSGSILMTSCLKIDADRNGVAKTSYEGKASGGYMMLV